MSNSESDLVSVIVPAYNSDQFINQCLQSIFNQTYPNIEIMVIDDGSTDQTNRLVRKLIGVHSNLNLITTKNNGVSTARNLGIEKSTGKYVTFVDADDEILPAHIEELHDNMIHYQTDMSVVFPCSDHTKSENDKKHLIKKNEFINKIFTENSIGGFCWNKLFLRKIIVNNNIKFSEKISMFEDMLFVINYAEYIDSIVISENRTYFYRKNSESVTVQRAFGNYFEKKWLSEVEALKDMRMIITRSFPLVLEDYTSVYLYELSVIRLLIMLAPNMSDYKCLLNKLNDKVKRSKKIMIRSHYYSRKQKLKFFMLVYMPWLWYVKVRLRGK